MKTDREFPYVDVTQLERIERAKFPPLPIRWWVLPFALLICVIQTVIIISVESRGSPYYLVSSQTPAVSFGILFVLVLVMNPLIGLSRVAKPLNRGEMMAVFAAMFVTAGISSYGLIDQLLPMVAAPFNSQWNTRQRGWDVSVIPYLKKQLFITDPAVMEKFRVGFSTQEDVLDKIPWSAFLEWFGILLPLIFVVWCGIAAAVQRLILSKASQVQEGSGSQEAWYRAVLGKFWFWAGFVLLTALCVGLGWDRKAGLATDWEFLRSAGSDIQTFLVWFASPERSWRRIPWMAWMRPLSLWMVLVLAVYLTFYSLSLLLYDAWARREKIVFPLARLPESLIAEEGDRFGIASGFKSGLFWIGFAMAGGYCAYAAYQMLLRPTQPVEFGPERDTVISLLSNSIFKGIANNAEFRFNLQMSFSALGIAFLLPVEVSRSIWSYYLFAIFLMLMAIWGKFGDSATSFPSNMYWQNNFITGLGAGGLLAFALVYLAKLVMDRATIALEASAELSGWPLAKRVVRDTGWSAILLFVGSGVSVAWLCWCGIPIGWGLGFFAVILLLYVGLMRMVAEAGIFTFTIDTGPFHLVKILGLAKSISAAALAPLLPIFSVVLFEPRASMAPAVLNSFKMQEDTRASKRTFHLIVILAIIVTLFVSIMLTLYLTYQVGANRTKLWHFTYQPQAVLDQTRRLVSGELGNTGGQQWIAYLIGGAWVAFSFFARRRFFWFPHPIGFAMLVNTQVRSLWLPFLIGWFFKKMAVKYGGRQMFAKVCPLFLGLIFGELVAYFFIVWIFDPSYLQ